jgi:hypothetical protein
MDNIVLYISRIFLIFSVLISLYFAVWNTLWSMGDELPYLTLTHSLIYDRDFNVKNNYDNRDYFHHHEQVIESPHAFPDKQNGLRSSHAVATSVLSIPGYLARKMVGARINFWLYFVFGLWLISLLLEQLKFDELSRNFGLALFAIQPAIIFYASAIFPDLIQGFWILISIILLLLYKERDNKFILLPSGFILGLSTFFHFKLIVFQSFIIFCFILLEAIKIKKNNLTIRDSNILIKITYLALPVLIVNLFASWINFRWFGFFRPDTMTPFLLNTEATNPANPFSNIISLFFDYRRGLIPYSPLLILLFPGLVIWFKRSLDSFILVALPSILYIFTIAFFSDWSAGWCPPGRYTMTSLPLLLPALVFYIREIKTSKIVEITTVLLTIVSLAMTYLIFKIPYYGYPFEKTNQLLDSVLIKLKINPNYLDINMSDLDFNNLLLLFILLINLLYFGYKLSLKNKKL